MQSITEVKATLQALKEAYNKQIASSGVTQYSINSGQSSSSVTQASLSALRNEISYYENLLNDLENAQNGGAVNVLRGF